jgi:hypothetical protein
MIQDKDSKLFLPESFAKSRNEETWLYDTVKKLRYAAKEMDAKEVDMALSCRRCGKPLQLETEGMVVEQRTGRLVCDCKVRNVR